MGFPELTQLHKLPPEVEAKLPEISEDACQACFALIGARLELLGYPVTGDFTPAETLWLDECFQSFVRAMAVNNPKLVALNF